MNEAYAEAFIANLGYDNWPTLDSLQEISWHYDHLADKPSTFIFCLQDEAETPEEQEIAALRFQVQRCVKINAGHQVMNTRPHTLAEVLLHEVQIP